MIAIFTIDIPKVTSSAVKRSSILLTNDTSVLFNFTIQNRFSPGVLFMVPIVTWKTSVHIGIVVIETTIVQTPTSGVVETAALAHDDIVRLCNRFFPGGLAVIVHDNENWTTAVLGSVALYLSRTSNLARISKTTRPASDRTCSSRTTTAVRFGRQYRGAEMPDR